MAYDWAASKLKGVDEGEGNSDSEIQNPITQYKLLLLLDAHLITPGTDLIKAAKEQLPLSPHTLEGLSDYIRHHPKDVAIILDGMVGKPTSILSLKASLIVITIRSVDWPNVKNDLDDFLVTKMTRYGRFSFDRF